MFNHPNPTTLRNNTGQETSSPLLGRYEALALFILLQRQGYAPYMIEDHTGQYRVSHD